MNPFLQMQNLATRIRVRHLFHMAYHKALIPDLAWQTERGLHMLLCGGAAGMVLIAIWQFSTQQSSQPPYTPPTSQPQHLLSAIPLSQSATDTMQQRDNSLFSLPPPVPMTADAPLTPLPAPARHPAQPLPRWQMQVKSLSSSPTVQPMLAEAYHDMQRGEFAMARQRLQVVLAQDTHQVEALAGMLLICKKLGDLDGEQIYLEQLGQIIPGYVYDDEVRLLSELE